MIKLKEVEKEYTKSEILTRSNHKQRRKKGMKNKFLICGGGMNPKRLAKSTEGPERLVKM